MPFLLAEILNFQGSTHLIGVGSLSQVLSVMSLRLMQHELQHGAIRAFYQADGEWNRKFKLVYHKNKFLTPAIYELEKILHTYQHMDLPKKMGMLH